ncbi:MAG: hypothetical protein IJC05_06110 [Phascolarctobacterium sp.]|nr:hypothetical protein [Phascolarctobacterium sp.]
MIEERQRNFKAAKQQATETEQEESSVRERNFMAMEEYVANKQLTAIHTAIEKLGKQNETLQKKYAEGLQLNLQNYLDSRVVDATARILKQHCEKIENIQSHNAYYSQKINEKLEILLGLVGMTFVAIAGVTIYRYFFR